MIVPNCKLHTEIEQLVFSVANTERTNTTCYYSSGLGLSTLMGTDDDDDEVRRNISEAR